MKTNPTTNPGGRYGTPHTFMPDDFEDAALIYAIDFEEDHTKSPEALIHRNATVFLDLADLVGVNVLWGNDPKNPDWDLLEARLNWAGHDTYNSDTRLEVYAGHISCGEDCAEECSPRPSRVRTSATPGDTLGVDMADPHGIPRPSRVDRARAWLADMADYLDRIDDDNDDDDALETLEDALRALEAADMADPHGVARPSAQDVVTASLRGTLGRVQEFTASILTDILNGTYDAAQAERDLEELETGDLSLRGALLAYADRAPGDDADDPNTAPGDARAYRVTFILGTLYEATVNAHSAAEAAALIDTLDEDDLDDIEVTRHALNATPVQFCDACGEEMPTGTATTCGDCTRYYLRTTDDTDQDGQP